MGSRQSSEATTHAPPPATTSIHALPKMVCQMFRPPSVEDKVESARRVRQPKPVASTSSSHPQPTFLPKATCMVADLTDACGRCRITQRYRNDQPTDGGSAVEVVLEFPLDSTMAVVDFAVRLSPLTLFSQATCPCYSLCLLPHGNFVGDGRSLCAVERIILFYSILSILHSLLAGSGWAQQARRPRRGQEQGGRIC